MKNVQSHIWIVSFTLFAVLTQNDRDCDIVKIIPNNDVSVELTIAEN